MSSQLWSRRGTMHQLLHTRCPIGIYTVRGVQFISSHSWQYELTWVWFIIKMSIYFIDRHNCFQTNCLWCDVSNHQHLDCLLNRLFRRRSKKTSKLRVTGHHEGNPPVTGGFPSQRASNAENVPFDDVIMIRRFAAPFQYLPDQQMGRFIHALPNSKQDPDDVMIDVKYCYW